MWSSLRAIADEALATAKELRDVPNVSVHGFPYMFIPYMGDKKLNKTAAVLSRIRSET